MSVATPLRTPRARSPASSKSPLPRKRFEVGQKTGCAPVSARAPISRSSRWIAWPKKGLRTDQPVSLIDVEIVARLGIEFGGVGDLVAVLREMGLDVALRMLGGERAGHLQLLGTGRDGEARRDRVSRPADPVPFPDELPAVVIGRPRRVQNGLGRVAVHHRLAADHTHVPARGLLEEGLGGALVARAERDGGGGAVVEEPVAEPSRHRPRVLGVREFRLGREGVAVQPVEKLAPPARHDLDLREVDVGVDEARHEKHRPVIGHRRVAGETGNLGPVARRPDHPVRDQQRAVLEIVAGFPLRPGARLGPEREEPSPQDRIGHALLSVLPARQAAQPPSRSRSTAIRTRSGVAGASRRGQVR